MAAILNKQHDPYKDGLGKSSQLGIGFLRKVNVSMNGDTTVTISTAKLDGANQIYSVVSIVLHTLDNVYVSAQTATSVDITSSDSAIFDVYLLVGGM